MFCGISFHATCQGQHPRKRTSGHPRQAVSIIPDGMALDEEEAILWEDKCASTPFGLKLFPE